MMDLRGLKIRLRTVLVEIVLLTACGPGEALDGLSIPSLPNPNSSPAASPTPTPTSVIYGSFSPTSGPVGTLVTLSGFNFTPASLFSIGSQAGVIISSSSSSLVGFVMPSTTSNSVSVTTTSQSVLNFSGTFTVTSTGYPTTQVTPKAVPTAASYTTYPQFGTAVALSADGSTAVIGGPADSTNAGAIWIFIRTNGVWSQQQKLIGSYAGYPQMGKCVAISADGNTVISGGPYDSSSNSNEGAAWIFTRSSGTWTQQQKLIPSDASASSNVGTACALSADGNTALIGGSGDTSGQGAFWIFTRSSGSWTQSGYKMVGTSASGTANQGSCVALSADAKTAVIGGNFDSYTGNSYGGAAWVFTQSGGAWSQQQKLIGTGTGSASFGSACAISADGNKVLIGAPNGGMSAGGDAWTFTRSNGVWTQLVNLYTQLSYSGTPKIGSAVALNADGTVALVGGPNMTSNTGTTWQLTWNGSSWVVNQWFGTGATTGSYFGYSTALSANATTAIVGGYQDGAGLGAFWTGSQ
jgi:hypothetical protein